MRLSELARGRDNNFQLIRLLAAAAVILFHCYALTDHWTDEPLWRLAPELNFGSLGVKIFFVVSGFLVTGSWESRQRLVPFAAARALRIYPGLLCATLFTILVAGACGTLPFAAFLADPLTLDYAWRTGAGWELRHQLPGAFKANPYPDAVNGSMWTLPIELRLYVGLAVAGLAGLLARRAAWLAAVAAATAVVVAQPAWFPLAPNDQVTRELALLFALGSLAWCWRERIVVSIPAAVAAIAFVAWNPAGLGRGPLLQPLLAYVVLVAAYHPRLQWPAFNRTGDYSYGLYVYSFPIQQALVQLVPGVAPVGLFGLALPATLVVAALSWHVVEKPALGLKSRFRSPLEGPA